MPHKAQTLNAKVHIGHWHLVYNVQSWLIR